MWFLSQIEVTCEACGVPFDTPRAPVGTPCICPECEATNLTPAAPPIRWERGLWALGVLALLALSGYGLYLYEIAASDLQALRDAALSAFQAQDYAGAREQYEKLAREELLTAESQFNLAQSVAALGDRKEARKMIREMLESAGTEWLPHTSRTYADAHFWLAQELYTRPKVSVDEWKEVEAHLRAVLMRAPQHDTARRMLLAMHRSTGNDVAALGELERLANRSAADRMALAMAYAQAGMKGHAAEEAELVLATLLVDLSETPDDVKLRWEAAHAAVMAGDFETAERQLKLALRYAGQQDAGTVARLAAAYAVQAREMPRDRPDWDRRALALLRQSLDLAPYQRQGYDALRPLLVRPGEVADEAKGLLLTGLARGVDPVWLHGLLAEAAGGRGKAAESILHWRTILAVQPDSDTALNNLAWELCWSNPPQLEEALELINRALAIDPRSAGNRETRGQILARLGRSQEALPELLSAVAEFSDSARLHATLSEVYRDLNLREEAQQHAERAAELSPGTKFEPVRVTQKTPPGE